MASAASAPSSSTNEEDKLTSEELSEIKKVWAVVDTDGSGTIDGSELKGDAGGLVCCLSLMTARHSLARGILAVVNCRGADNLCVCLPCGAQV